MKINTIIRLLTFVLLLGVANTALGAYKYKRVTSLSDFEDGWQVIITNTGATVAAGPLESGVLKGVPLTDVVGDEGEAASLGDATIFTMSKSSTQATGKQYELSTPSGKLGYNSSSTITYNATGYYIIWTVDVNVSELSLVSWAINKTVHYNKDKDTFGYEFKAGEKTTGTQLYRVTWVDEPIDPHDPWAEVYLVTSTNDYSREKGVHLEQDEKNPDVYKGFWKPSEEEKLNNIGISFIGYDPQRDTEYYAGPVGDTDEILAKSVAGATIEGKCAYGSTYHWIIEPGFWDKYEGQSLQVAINIHTGDVAFGKDIQTQVTSIACDAEEEWTYYTLQGVKVSHPEKGIYIRVKGSEIQKIVK